MSLEPLKRPVYIDLEGADLTGKSTLLHTSFRKSIYSQIMCFHDRGILTHYLYNTIFERFPENSYLWSKELYSFIKNNGIIILVALDENTLRHRFAERYDDIFKLESIIKINKEYNNFYESFLKDCSNVKRIFVDNKNRNEIFEEAEEFYKLMLMKGQ